MARTPPLAYPSLCLRRAAANSQRLRRLALIGLAWLSPLGHAHAARSCEQWSAEVSSVEGRVEVRRSAAPSAWVALASGERVCTGDVVQAGSASRATLVMPDGGILKLDADSTLNLPEPPSGEGSLLELLRGIIHVISRDPRSLSFRTPYANAGLEGTEFDIRVDERGRLTEVVVLEGEVVMTTPAGEKLAVASDHIAVARDGQPPTAEPIDHPIDRMRWASHYPLLIDGALPGVDQEPLPAEQSDANFYAGRAAANLNTARLEAAEADIAAALRLAPRHATALSLRALLALAHADRAAARAAVSEALNGDPSSVVARLASSYVEHSVTDPTLAERAVREALAIEPNNALALTRLAELALARDDAATAITLATRARTLAPSRSGPLVVLGFANLRAFDTAAAEDAFAAAVALEPDAPLPRLGLGLALIRRDDLAGGRRQLELAVASDPANPLTRNYMAAAYDAEHRADLTASQLELAQEFDPFDPTAWLYSALQKLRSNRPVEALQDFRAAARINGDQPAVRSTLTLDEDLGTRGAALGRMYGEAGFGQLALLDAWKILGEDPASFTGHRLLSDAYSNEPRHEIARVSELLASQLQQPANTAPVKPQLGQQNLILAQRMGPSSPSFDEFDSPVVANGLELRASAASGSNGTDGHDVSLAGLHDAVSYSAGHYSFSTDGIRANNDYEQEVANAFVQYRPTHDTSLQAELRSTRTEHGDLSSFFYRDVYSAMRRQDEDADSMRLGVKQQLTPAHTLLASVIYQDVLYGAVADEVFSVRGDLRAYGVDVQHIYDGGGVRILSGVLAARQDENVDATASFPGFEFVDSYEQANRQLGAYAYAYFDPLPTLTLTTGVSLDSIANPDSHEDAASPKIGVVWRPTPATTVRAAAFETLFGSLTTSVQNAQPRLEPVQVAGFTQLLFGGTADKSTVRGLAIEHELSRNVLVGWQADTRETERTGATPFGPTDTASIDLRERAREAYLYWMPARAVSVSARYEHGHASSDPVLAGYSDMETTRVPIEIRFFSPRGLTIGTRASHVQQKGAFQNALLQLGQPLSLAYGEDEFWVVDAFIGYRLPNRRGLLSLNADNLFDEDFQFQDIDPTNPSLFPERLISFRFTLAFE